MILHTAYTKDNPIWLLSLYEMESSFTKIHIKAKKIILLFLFLIFFIFISFFLFLDKRYNTKTRLVI